jgi:hypothetical protein
LKHIGSTSKESEIDGLKKLARYTITELEKERAKAQKIASLFPDIDNVVIDKQTDTAPDMIVNLKDVIEDKRIIQ